MFDVAVVGAGPAGAVTASHLARLGHRVCLFHREPASPPTAPVWETISPGVLAMLERHEPAVWRQLTPHLLRGQASLSWSHDDATRTESARSRPVTLIDRRVLDPVLRESAVRAGAHLICSRAGVAPRRVPNGSWRLRSADRTATSSRLLIDAAGRGSPVSGQRTLHGPRCVALTALVTGTRLEPGTTWVEAAPEGWLWAARPDQAVPSITFMLAPGTLRRSSPPERAETFLRLLSLTSLPAGRGSLALASPLTARNAILAERDPLLDVTSIKVGDAALAFDPVAAQGLQHALTSARHCAAVLHTQLRRGDSAPIAEAFYRARHAESLAHHRTSCGTVYRLQDRYDTVFWRARRAAFPRGLSLPMTPNSPADARPPARVALSPDVRWEMTPVLADDFIEEQEALTYPGLARPMAYLEDRPIRRLLLPLAPSIPVQALVAHWMGEEDLTLTAATRILTHLWINGVLIEAPLPMSHG